ncbi:Hypothetical predicted protein [Cloeon dipterum]|uniref:Uncharacterized protein n=1 Tax=Cloeon dipterum TaxID=197152 RepID=A0A8S1CUD5_9INSE|nr:Hypothetical predicted protein [Cloeon dipterum]
MGVMQVEGRERPMAVVPTVRRNTHPRTTPVASEQSLSVDQRVRDSVRARCRELSGGVDERTLNKKDKRKGLQASQTTWIITTHAVERSLPVSSEDLTAD